MRIKRFVSADMRGALRRIRDELGPDAVILSNSRCDEGIEVTAAVDDAEAPVTPGSARERAVPFADSTPEPMVRVPRPAARVDDKDVGSDEEPQRTRASSSRHQVDSDRFDAVTEEVRGLRSLHPRGKLIAAFVPRSATASRSIAPLTVTTPELELIVKRPPSSSNSE